MDDKLYKAFLGEMHGLEDFRMTYAAEHPASPVDRDDPDVRRLMEALAFFSARTKLASLRSVARLYRRLFRQLLPYFLSPLPAMAIVDAVPTGKLAEAVVLPRGSEMALSGEGEQTAIFRTMRELRVLPITLGRVDFQLLPQGGYRLLLPFSASYGRNEEIGRLSLHINYLNDFHASLRVLHTLRQRLTRASVSFEERVDAGSKGTSCQVSFGLIDDLPAAAFPHPLIRERVFFHFPPSELFINIDVPAPPRNWQRFTLFLDVDSEWPRNLRLPKEVFRLFATPVVNLQRAMAQPIVCDGTQELWAVRHPNMGGRFELHSVRGVYRVGGEAMSPLRPGTLAGGSGSYEIDDDHRSGAHGHVLQLHLPEAFEKPCTVGVDAEWLQPWFSELVGRKLRVMPYARSLVGLDWEIVGDMVGHRDNDFLEQMDAFMSVLVLQHKTVLDRDELLTLLQGMGSVFGGPFASIRELLLEVKVKELPLQQGGGGGMRLVYQLVFRDFEQGVRPQVETFLVHLQRILDAWIPEAPVEVRIGDRG